MNFADFFPRKTLCPPPEHIPCDEIAPAQAFIGEYLEFELSGRIGPCRSRSRADAIETGHCQFRALQPIHLPHEGPEHVPRKITNLNTIALRAVRPEHARNRSSNFFQRVCDHSGVPEQFQSVFNCPRKNFFSRRQYLRIDFPAQSVHRVEAEETGRTFSSHCGYAGPYKQSGCLRTVVDNDTHVNEKTDIAVFSVSVPTKWRENRCKLLPVEGIMLLRVGVSRLRWPPPTRAEILRLCCADSCVRQRGGGWNMRDKYLLVSVVLSLAFITTIACNSRPNISGVWRGSIQASEQGGKNRWQGPAELTLNQNGAAISGSLVFTHPQGGRVQVPITSGVASSDSVTFAGQSQFPLGGSIEITFHGKVSGTSLAGTTDMTSRGLFGTVTNSGPLNLARQ